VAFVALVLTLTLLRAGATGVRLSISFACRSPV
jgi:hypothetical protein